uniref:Uncharacterized protein n=1 Tax=Eutreptiella gymnastica TaxID=73025 RepID=A0A7S4G595_9EUGL
MPLTRVSPAPHISQPLNGADAQSGRNKTTCAPKFSMCQSTVQCKSKPLASHSIRTFGAQSKLRPKAVQSGYGLALDKSVSQKKKKKWACVLREWCTAWAVCICSVNRHKTRDPRDNNAKRAQEAMQLWL